MVGKAKSEKENSFFAQGFDDLTMKAKIAVATVSGRAYYKLVNELKSRGLPFLSLTPHKAIPIDIAVVLTTPPESRLIKHSKVLIYNEDSDPATVVNDAVRIVKGRGTTDTISIGIDPGKTFGLAVLSDGNVLETHTCASVQETVKTTLKILKTFTASVRIVKVGGGAPSYTQELLPLLDEALPKDVAIEVVSEAGTSRFVGENIHRRGLRDAISAVKIAERRGRLFQREEDKNNEANR